MPKVAEPWQWDARKGWYAWIKGSRVRLASFDEGVNKAKKQLRKLLEEADAPKSGPVLLVGEIFVKYLADLKLRRESKAISEQTKADAERRTAGFAEMHGDTPVDAIRPHHVEAWLATRADWGPTSQHDGIGAVKTVFRWAKKKGHIEANPIADMEKPKRKAKRDRIPKAGEVGRAFAAIITPEFRDLMLFIHGTGCRPKEARTMEARHLDRAGGRVVLSEHKTARKTGKDRIIYLTPATAEIARRLADLHPDGPIFRNTKGEPWTSNAVGLTMRRLRARTGLGRDMVAYSFRHGFITEGLAKGVSTAIMAELAGHANTRMLDGYSHLSEHHDALREAVEKVRGDGAPGL